MKGIKAVETKDMQVFFKLHYNEEVSYALDSDCKSTEALKDLYIDYIAQWINECKENMKFDEKLIFESFNELYDFNQWVHLVGIESGLVELVEIVF